MDKELKEKISELLDVTPNVAYTFNDEKKVLVIVVDYTNNDNDNVNVRATASYVYYSDFNESNYEDIINSITR